MFNLKLREGFVSVHVFIFYSLNSFNILDVFLRASVAQTLDGLRSAKVHPTLLSLLPLLSIVPDLQLWPFTVSMELELLQLELHIT